MHMCCVGQKQEMRLSTINATKFLNKICSKVSSLDQQTEKYTRKMLLRMERQEMKIARKLAAKDSVAGKTMMQDKARFYSSMKSKMEAANLVGGKQDSHKEYIPYLDSINTSIKFLETRQEELTNKTGELKTQLARSKEFVSQYQNRLQAANEIKQKIKERRAQLKQELKQYGLDNQLKKLSKESYYYTAQLQEYKTLLNDRKKIEKKAMTALRETPAFREFMQKNSELTKLFKVPNNYGSAEALAGLQSRASVMEQLQSRIGVASPNASAGGAQGNPAAFLQKNIQQAQGEMNRLKEQANTLGMSSGGSDSDMPNFKPNSQKTKSFLKRLEYGFNIQSQGAKYYIPATSDLALSLGYKFNDKLVTGVGMSYKLGFGRPFNDIKFSSEGVGIRSYTDLKLKGSFWLSAGYEINHLQAFDKLSAIYDVKAWQQSGLVGLSKKVKIKAKKEMKVQLLWDFLGYNQLPKGEVLKFRVGYNFSK